MSTNRAASFDAYRAALRKGRGAPLGPKRRRGLWSVFESVLARLEQQAPGPWVRDPADEPVQLVLSFGGSEQQANAPEPKSMRRATG